MLNHLFTGVDNQTYDLGRVLWALTILGFLAESGWAVIGHAAVFDPMAWGTGAAALLAGGGAALRLKTSTEPQGR